MPVYIDIPERYPMWLTRVKKDVVRLMKTASCPFTNLPSAAVLSLASLRRSSPLTTDGDTP
jgi:hypothetical protein